MVQERVAVNQGQGQPPENGSYYTLLDLTPGASAQDIRRAYREKSKLFHPDTTDLPPAIATEKFQQLNEAYATLSSPERRQFYDRQMRYSQIPLVHPPASVANSRSRLRTPTADLNPSERPLSAGELFALFLLGLTFLGCLVLAIIVGCTRGDIVLQAASLPRTWSQFQLPLLEQQLPSPPLIPQGTETSLVGPVLVPPVAAPTPELSSQPVLLETDVPLN